MQQTLESRRVVRQGVKTSLQLSTRQLSVDMSGIQSGTANDVDGSFIYTQYYFQVMIDNLCLCTVQPCVLKIVSLICNMLGAENM